MKIGGIIPFTLVDFPGRPAAVVFAAGCNLRCPFCHNPELVTGSGELDTAEVLAFLETRQGKLQGVCISGGEPTLYPGLVEFITQVKDLGFQVKLDTNGTSPQVLEELLGKGLLDYVAMDVKSSLEKYELACGKKVDPEKVVESVELLRSWEISYELRTTAVPGLVELSDLSSLGKWLGRVPKYVLQQFRPAKTLDPKLSTVKPYDAAWFNEAVKLAHGWADEVMVRGA